jgi:hypothetical protein
VKGEGVLDSRACTLASPAPARAGDLLEIVIADVSDASQLKPELFEGVVAVVACTAAIVQPKEGDGPDRAKYYQGIKVGAYGATLWGKPTQAVQEDGGGDGYGRQPVW